MKNFNKKPFWRNRHLDPLPKEGCRMQILYKDFDGIYHPKGEWEPVETRKETIPPAEGFLGTFVHEVKNPIRKSPGVIIGYHAWSQNDSEFVYYRILADE
jgi:hypothetical protein